METYFISKIIKARSIPEALRLEKKGKAEIVEIFKEKNIEVLPKKETPIIGF